MKKIAFLTSHMNGIGGIATLVKSISIELAKEYDVYIVGMDNEIMIDQGIHVIDYNFNPKEFICSTFFRKIIKGINQFTPIFDNRYCVRLLSSCILTNQKKNNIKHLIQHNKFDVVIGVAGTNTMLLGSVKKDFSNVKFIGWQLNSYDAYFSTKRKYLWHQKAIYKQNLSMLDEYIVLSTQDKESISKNFHVDSKIIYNGLQLEGVTSKINRNKVIIAAGHLWEGKGFDLLIKSANLISNKIPDWEFHIYGEGPLKNKLNDMIIHYGLEEKVLLKGTTYNMKSTIDQASIFALSSRWEGMPMVLITALDSGIPIVSYDIPAVEFIVEDDYNGYIVSKYDYTEFSNKLLELASFDKIKLMGKNSSIKSHDFDICNIVLQWKQLF